MSQPHELTFAGARLTIEEVAADGRSMVLRLTWSDDGEASAGGEPSVSHVDYSLEHAAAALRRSRERLTLRSTGRVGFLKTADIEWVDAAHNYVRIHTLDGKTHVAREPIGELEARLDHDRFLRIHRSTIINADCVRELEVSVHGNYVAILTSGQRLSVSRSFKDRLPLLLGA